MARPKVKFDPERSAVICERLKAGCTRKDAAQSAGISYSTFDYWMTRLPEFATRVNAAEATVAVLMSGSIVKAAQAGDWRAAESWLKRRRRDEWGDSLNLTNRSDDDLLSEAAEILKRAGAGGPDGADAPGADDPDEREGFSF